mgnify:CR=1 FL=1|tara:strand:+ start:2519 stop:3922 length:1404 start_codon:yes stop_codon:yes gene_type:complete
MKLDRNDPRLTAFALEELSGDERANVEQELEQLPDGGEAVSEILETVGALRVGFAAEEAAMRDLPFTPKVIRPTFWQRSIVRAGMVAAACVAACVAVVFVSIRNSEKQLAAAPKPIEEELEEVTIGEFRITIQTQDQPKVVAKNTDSVAVPRAGIVEPKISPKGKLVPTPVSIPVPSVQLAHFIDPLPDHLRSLRFIDPLDRKIASFPMEVDVTSFDLVKRELKEGRLPDSENVHIEQWVNAFDYDYPLPESGSQRFRLDLEVAACPWQPQHRLVRIGVKSAVSADGGPVALNPAIGVDFNPLRVSGYRFIGDLKPASEPDGPALDQLTKSGHTMTALYEIVLVEDDQSKNGGPQIPKDGNRMASLPPGKLFPIDPEMLTVELVYQEPKGGSSRVLRTELVDGGAKFSEASDDFRFAAAIATLGEQLQTGEVAFDEVANLAEAALGDDESGKRREFVDLLRKAGEMQ